ncbi:TPA: transcriptional regulator, partial [Streptococcus pneumoniae]|nr:transcriptional regulator [Streptococcus pneumoniae]
YKMEQRMPQSPWVERIVQILDLDYEDLFRR